uniref:Uncharacterized protein n=1 Tax=Lepeophtheirus salmonis TaxID=72036 RepID=A0A0K2UQ57_LEPSM
MKNLGYLIFGDMKNLFRHLKINRLIQMWVNNENICSWWRCSVTRCGHSLTIKTGTCFSTWFYPFNVKSLSFTAGLKN